MILLIELLFIWLITYAFGAIAAKEMPLWMISILIIVTDRATTFVTEIALHWKDRMQD